MGIHWKILNTAHLKKVTCTIKHSFFSLPLLISLLVPRVPGIDARPGKTAQSSEGSAVFAAIGSRTCVWSWTWKQPVWWSCGAHTCCSLSWTLRSSCAVWTTLWNNCRAVPESSGRAVAFSFLSPHVWPVCVCPLASPCSGACLSPIWFSLLARARSWQTLTYQSHAFSQEKTEENSGDPRFMFYFCVGCFQRLWETQTRPFGNFFTPSSYFCHILSSPVCCWVGGKIKAPWQLVIPFGPHSGM